MSAEPEVLRPERGPLVLAFTPGVVAGVLAIVAAGRGTVSGAGKTAILTNSAIVLGILMIAGFGALVIAGREPAFRIAGMAFAPLAGLFLANSVVQGRLSDRFPKGASLHIESGGRLALVAAALCAVTALLVAFVPAWRPGGQKSANTALICSALGVLALPLAAIGLGLGRHSVHGDDLQLTRRAQAAVVLGVTALLSWTALFGFEAILAGR